MQTAERAWAAFRRWRWWQQALLWLIWPIPAWLWAFGSQRPRRITITVAVAATALFIVIGVTNDKNPDTTVTTTASRASGASTTARDAAGVASTAKPRRTTTTAAPTSTTATPTTTSPATTVPEVERAGDHASNGDLYKNRPGAKDADHERAVGETPIRFAGFSIWVKSVAYVEHAGQYRCCGYLKVHVRILNRDKDTQTWFEDDFSIQTPNGEEYSPTSAFGADGQPLGINGGLVHGGFVEGDVWFHVGKDRGQFFILWQPHSKPSEDDRGVWGTSI